MRRLAKGNPDVPEAFEDLVTILATDPRNTSRRHSINANAQYKKLRNVEAGNGQWRIRSGVYRLRYEWLDSCTPATYGQLISTGAREMLPSSTRICLLLRIGTGMPAAIWHGPPQPATTAAVQVRGEAEIVSRRKRRPLLSTGRWNIFSPKAHSSETSAARSSELKLSGLVIRCLG